MKCLRENVKTDIVKCGNFAPKFLCLHNLTPGVEVIYASEIIDHPVSKRQPRETLGRALLRSQNRPQ